MRWSNGIVGAVMGVVLAACGTGTARGDIVVADSQAEFSGTQGANGWSYRYDVSWAKGEYGASAYNPTGDMWGYGSAGAWEGGADERIIKEGQHPGYSGSDPVLAIRRWTSDVAGPVTISGALAKLDTRGGDGVDCSIWVNTTQVYQCGLAGTDGVGVSYSFSTNLSVGDTVDFVVDPRTWHGNDATMFTATISQVPEPGTLTVLGAGLLGLLAYAWRKQR